jgi:hypothetical protein
MLALQGSVFKALVFEVLKKKNKTIQVLIQY